MSGFSDYVLGHLANRVDAFGAYRRGKAFVVKEPLTAQVLEAHECGERTVGIFAGGLDGLSRFGVIDLDAPDNIDDADARDLVAQENFGACQRVCERLVRMGYAPLVEDSDGAGSFHVWITFTAPSPTAEVFGFLKAVLRDVGIEAETFPKQADIGHGYGSWIRLLGRHPRRDHWSRVWSFAERRWLSYEDSIAVFCDHEESPPPTEAETPPPCEELGKDGVPGASDAASDDVIPEGGRNAALASLAGTMRRRGMREEEILAALLEVNRGRCAPPLPEEEVRKIAESVTRYDPEDPLKFAASEPQSAEAGLKTLNERLFSARVASVRRILRRGGVGGAVDIELSDGQVFPVGNVATLLSFDTFRKRLADGTRIVIPAKLRKEWDPIAQLMISLMEDVEGESSASQVEAFLRDVLEADAPVDADDEEEFQSLLASRRKAFFRRSGRLYVRLNVLAGLNRRHGGVDLKSREFGDELARSGWTYVKLSCGGRDDRVRLAAYAAPEGWGA